VDDNRESAARPLTIGTDEENLFRSTCRTFAEARVAPLVRDMDENARLDPGLIHEIFELGLMGIQVGEEYGGSAGTFMMSIIAIEEISRIDASVGVFVDVQNTLVNNAVVRWGTEAQKRELLPHLASDRVGAFALSEAGSGSDAFSLECRARQGEDGFVLTGRKLWTTNGAEAGLFIVFANARPELGHKGITAFLVDRATSGFAVGRKEDKLGIRASSTCELLLDECRVGADRVLGEVGKGYRIAIETLNEGRIGIGAQMLGIARGSLEHGVKYAQERTAFGKTISEFQGIRFQLAQAAAEVEAARLLVYNAARLRDHGGPFATEAAIAKHLAADVAERVTSLMIEVYGGYGYTKDYPVEKYYRDAKIGKIYEGTSNMQLETIARSLLG
jgi:alkylation response protein AidB-like acyl-CoA dehydrogenase